MTDYVAKINRVKNKEGYFFSGVVYGDEIFLFKVEADTEGAAEKKIRDFILRSAE